MISVASPPVPSLDHAPNSTAPAERVQVDSEDAAVGSRISLAVWIVTLFSLLWIPLKIIGYGYLPPDDALRHAGKAISQRDWNQILVVREGFELDHNPGWHWLLTQLHRATGAGADALVITAVCVVFLAALVAPALWMRRPEAWLGALLISALTFPAVLPRVLLGRPFALTIGVVLAILLWWRKDEKPAPGKLALTTALLALSAWAHGAWYLFAVVIAAFTLAGQRRSALWLSGCWATGTVLGALATGHPIAFLGNALRIVGSAFGGDVLQRMLVSEFWPSDGNVIAVLAVCMLVLWRYLSGRWTWACLNNPIFWLAVLGWILGLRVSRFYSDWAAPALLLWVALELSEHFERLLAADAPRRLLVTAGLGLALVFVSTADHGSRWTNALALDFLSAEDQEAAAWLPENKGILYAADMGVFYQTFFKNPQASWRYILGFEPTFMPEDDLQIYRNIQRNFGAFKAYAPWVEKMRPEDRLAIRSTATSAPGVEGLEWHHATRDLWLGRKPHSSSADQPLDTKAAGGPPGGAPEAGGI